MPNDHDVVDMEDDANAGVADTGGRGAKRSFSEHVDETILIPMERNANDGTTRYVTMSKYVEEKGKPPSDTELDSKAILIKSPSGTYLTRAGTYQSISVNDVAEPDDKARVKEERFGQRMQELGLSAKSFHEVHEGKLVDEERHIETPGGKRRQFQKYVHPEQAGVNSPDAMVRNGDGEFLALYPKFEKDIRTLEQFKEKYGEEVYLKNKGNNYVPPEIDNKRHGHLTAEKRFAYFKGEPLHNERQDMPKVLFRVEKDGHEEYVSKNVYEKEVGKVDFKKADILFQSPSGKSLLNVDSYRRIDPAGFKDFLKSEKLKEEDVTRKVDRTRSEVLVVANGRVMGAKMAREFAGLEPGAPLANTFGRNNVYVENLGKHNKTTGNYRDAPSVEARAARDNPRDVGRLEALGVYKNPALENIANVMKTDGLLIDKLAALKLDHRPRTRDGIGVAA